MSRIIGDALLIEPEPEAECAMCGRMQELRPYGPGGARVCHDCAMKNPEEMQRRMIEAISRARYAILSPECLTKPED